MPQIEIKRGRLQSWGGQIWTAKGFEGSDPAYAGHIIFPKDHIDPVLKIPTLVMIDNAITQAAKDKFGESKNKDGIPAYVQVLKAAKLNNKIPVHDGDAKADSDGYAGNMFVSARSPGDKPAPQVVHRILDANGGLIPVSQADGVIYDGCFVNMIVDIFGYDKGSNGIGARLRAVRYVAPGDAFGGGAPVAASAFSAIPEDADIEL